MRPSHREECRARTSQAMESGASDLLKSVLRGSHGERSEALFRELFPDRVQFGAALVR